MYAHQPDHCTAVVISARPNPCHPEALVVMVRCPHCGGRHTHGLVDGATDWRMADCGAGEYRVTLEAVA